MTPETNSAESVQLVGEVRPADIGTGSADTGTVLWPLVHMGPPLDINTVVVQATRKPLIAGIARSRGTRVTLSELERGLELPLRLLTPDDVPLEAWGKHLEQYSVREDGVLVTNQPLVGWGKLTPEGRIAWFFDIGEFEGEADEVINLGARSTKG